MRAARQGFSVASPGAAWTVGVAAAGAVGFVAHSLVEAASARRARRLCSSWTKTPTTALTMSSETSTEHGRHQPVSTTPAAPSGMHAWQFFCPCAIQKCDGGKPSGSRTGPDRRAPAVLLMATTVLVGIRAARDQTVCSDYDDRTVVVGASHAGGRSSRRRPNHAAHDRRTEFDRAMGKMSEEDFREMSSVPRPAPRAPSSSWMPAPAIVRLKGPGSPSGRLCREARRCQGARVHATRSCPACSTSNDTDARFCKSCGERRS